MTRLVPRRSGLAIDGGPPIRSRPWPAWPHFDDDERAAVDAVLTSGRVNYWTGENGRCFERDFAAWVGVPYAVAVTNGTVALEIALRAVGVAAGAEVILPSATFIATAGAVVACGAQPVVVDVDRTSRCLTAESIEPAITVRTVAIVVVHLGGFPADMEPILRLARQHGLFVVEDCAHRAGAHRAGRMVGTRGDVAAWSFCQDKIMTTAGESGVITTADANAWRLCCEYKDHGRRPDAETTLPHPSGFRWLRDSFGTNARMTEVQAAVGRCQLSKVDGWVAARRARAAELSVGLRYLDALRLPTAPTDAQPAFYRYHVDLRADLLPPGWDRDRFVAALQAEGVPATYGGCFEIHRERAFRNAGMPPRLLPAAAALSRTGMTLPVNHRMSASDTDDVLVAVHKVLRQAAR